MSRAQSGKDGSDPSLPPEEPVVVVKMSFHTPSTRRADVGHMDDVLMMILLLFLQKQN